MGRVYANARTGKKSKHGSSRHRLARVAMFQAKQKKKAEKRKRKSR